MKYLSVAFVCVIAVGCAETANPPPASNSNTSVDRTVAPDNTGVNVRDRDADAKTAIKQDENQADVDTTAAIRKRVVDSKLSTNAKNVKIITQSGHVTLRGPVETADEKAAIEAIAVDVAGAGKVTNDLEVTTL